MINPHRGANFREEKTDGNGSRLSFCEIRIGSYQYIQGGEIIDDTCCERNRREFRRIIETEGRTRKFVCT